jgi:alpha-glucosidase
MVSNINSVTSQLSIRGLLNSNSSIKIDADGTHTESYWRREFGAAFLWLFPNITTSVRNVTALANKVRIVPNPIQHVFQIADYKVKLNDVISLISAQGSVVKTWKGNLSSNYVVGNLSSGVYTVLINGIPAGRFVKQ